MIFSILLHSLREIEKLTFFSHIDLLNFSKLDYHLFTLIATLADYARNASCGLPVTFALQMQADIVCLRSLPQSSLLNLPQVKCSSSGKLLELSDRPRQGVK